MVLSLTPTLSYRERRARTSASFALSIDEFGSSRYVCKLAVLLRAAVPSFDPSFFTPKSSSQNPFSETTADVCVSLRLLSQQSPHVGCCKSTAAAAFDIIASHQCPTPYERGSQSAQQILRKYHHYPPRLLPPMTCCMLLHTYPSLPKQDGSSVL